MKKMDVSFQELPYSLEESLNRLRVNIKFCGENTKRILITSSVPDEGKSFVSVHLWRLLAEAGFKTVLLDVDMRKSMLKRDYNLDTEGEMTGINHYLSGQAELGDCIYKTDEENAFIIPCTGNLMNPSSLLEDPKLEGLLDSLSKAFRYIIIDSPPLHNVADGAQIATLCDGAVLVVRAGYTQKKLIAESFKQLEMVGCKLLGTVLNFVETGTGRYGKYYGKYYGKHYGKGTEYYTE